MHVLIVNWSSTPQSACKWRNLLTGQVWPYVGVTIHVSISILDSIFVSLYKKLEKIHNVLLIYWCILMSRLGSLFLIQVLTIQFSAASIFCFLEQQINTQLSKIEEDLLKQS